MLMKSLSLGCIIPIDKPTRLTETSSTIIDHFYTNELLTSIDSKIILSDITDHFPILLNINYSTLKTETIRCNSYYRDNSQFNPENFLIELEHSFLQSFILNDQEYSINSRFQEFDRIFLQLLNKHIPLKCRTRKDLYRWRKPWMNKNILQQIKTKNNLFQKFLKSRDIEDLQKYKSFRNSLSKIIRRNKVLYYQNRIKKSQKNISEIWKTVREIINVKPYSKNAISHITNSNGDCVTDPNEIPNELNNFFCSIGTSLATNISSDNSNCIYNTIKPPLTSFYLPNISTEFIVSTISNMNDSKLVPCDSIPIKYIKMANIIIAPVLCKLINCCIDQGCFPNHLKIAQIIPIYKSGKKDEPSNYRPISLLNPVCKIFEKYLYEQLNQYFLKNNYIMKTQYGFRVGHSTTLAVADVYDDLVLHKDNGNVSCSIFLDLKKAFDTVDHCILLKKLYCYGVRGIAFDLICDYLHERVQFTRINNYNSNLQSVCCGVPQGSTLGPFLFIIYINDLANITSFKTCLFADDTNFTVSSKNINELQVIAQKELSLVNKWIKSNKLTINLSKSEYILVSNKNTNTSDFILTIDDNILQKKRNVKYLGVYLDNNLTWKPHIEYLCTKLSAASYLLIKLRHYVDLKTLIAVYNSIVYSYIQYSIINWGRAYSTALQPLHILHKKILRIMNFSDFTAPSTPLFFKCNTLKIPDIYTLEVAKLIHNFLSKKNPDSFTNFFLLQNEVHHYSTRSSSSKNIFLPRLNTTLGKHSLRYQGALIWSKVPASIKTLEFNLFKCKFKHSLISSYNA